MDKLSSSSHRCPLSVGQDTSTTIYTVETSIQHAPLSRTQTAAGSLASRIWPLAQQPASDSEWREVAGVKRSKSGFCQYVCFQMFYLSMLLFAIFVLFFFKVLLCTSWHKGCPSLTQVTFINTHTQLNLRGEHKRKKKSLEQKHKPFPSPLLKIRKCTQQTFIVLFWMGPKSEHKVGLITWFMLNQSQGLHRGLEIDEPRCLPTG